MQFINWLSFNRKDNLYSTKKELIALKDKDINKNLYWEDIITHTQFYIPKEEYQTQKKQAFTDLSDKITVSKIYQYIQTSTDNNYFTLPIFFNEEQNKHKEILQLHRVKDHVLIRTGLLLCKYPKSEISDDLRCLGLLHNIFEDLEVYKNAKNAIGEELYNQIKEFLNFIDKFLLNDDNALETKHDFSFDIVKGGAIKIKNYYLETNDISNIRGASILLDEINKEIIPEELVKKGFFEENIIYCGGGKVLLFVPSGKGEDVKKLLSETIQTKTKTCQSNFGCKAIKLSEISSKNYKDTMNNFDRELENDGTLNTFFDNFDDTIELYSDDVSPLCDECKLRKATIKNQCESCNNKSSHDYIKVNEKKGFLKYFNEFATKNNLVYKSVSNKTLEEIAKNGSSNSLNTNIAIIYGDGNNMSLAIDGITSIAQMKYFSEMIDYALNNIVYYSLCKVLGNTCFNIIAIGGDDLFIIVPADKALDICLYIGKLFDKYFKNLTPKECTEINSITMSLGFCISKYKTPIQYTFNYAQQLLKTAKNKAWTLKKTGTLDFMALINENTLGYPVNHIRKLRYKHNYEDKQKEYLDTLRPYTWEQAYKIKKTIIKLNKYKTMILDFKDAVTKMHPDEAKLYMKYKITRDLTEEERNTHAEHKIVKAIKELGETFGYEFKDLFLVSNDTKYFTPWVDLSELWDFCGGETCDKESSENCNKA